MWESRVAQREGTNTSGDPDRPNRIIRRQSMRIPATNAQRSKKRARTVGAKRMESDESAMAATFLGGGEVEVAGTQ